jgi:outer membrane protein assembly factor BamB
MTTASLEEAPLARLQEDTMSADTLYIGCHGHVAAIAAATGTELWRTALGTGLLSMTAHQDVCLLENAGRVFAGCQGHLFCLDTSTGEVLWHNRLEGLGHNEVTLAMAGQSVQFVSQTARRPS